MLSIIEKLFESEIIRVILIYYIVGVILWSFFLIFGNVIKSRIEISDKNYRKIEILLSFFTVIFLSFLFIRAMNYVGYLPYGQDTCGYTYDVKSISEAGYWHGPKGYYAIYHTSAVFLSIFAEILSSVEIAYFLLNFTFLLLLTLSLSVAVSRFLHMRIQTIVFIAVLLFIASPNLGGFDLLQQFVSVVYAVAAVSALISNQRSLSFIPFLIFSVMAIITHLTSVILSLILLALYISECKKYKQCRIGFVIFIMTTLIYLFSSYTDENIVTTLWVSLKSLLQGTVGEYTVRALANVPTSKIFFFSWSLLPSMAFAYILMYFGEWIKHHVDRTKILVNESFDRFVLITFFLSLSLTFLGVLTGLAVYLVRYFVLPSYAMLLFSVSVVLGRIVKKCREKVTTILLLLLFLSPYVYSAIYSDGRSPWVGEPRLAPTTRIDRIEMLVIAQYGVEGYYLFEWHDIYIPYEEVGRSPYLIGGGSYYSVHDILKKIANGETVDIPENSYLIPLKYVLTVKSDENYSLIYSGYEHVVMVPK